MDDRNITAWPEGFIWGTGASSTQSEGAAPASDWRDWEAAGRAPRSGDGNGFGSRYEDDFALYASLGLTNHRMSIEWARIEPEDAQRDPIAIAHYRRVLEAAHSAGVAPWICLHHFSLPKWFAERGGFGSPTNRRETWRRHVEFMAETFGDLARGWKPVNEPVAFAFGGWLGEGNPPGRNDLSEFARQLEGAQLANLEAARVLRTTGHPVASVHNLSTVHAVEGGTAEMVDLVDAVVWDSWISPLRDGVMRVPGRQEVDCSELAGSFDLIGFSYYSAIGVGSGLEPVPYPTGAALGAMGHPVWPEGLRLVLDRLRDELPEAPLLISEYGLGTGDDGERSAYLEAGLRIAHEALAEGIDLRGFFHWTGVDNYEWLRGFDVQFGLIDRGRNVRPSAEVLRRAALGRAEGTDGTPHHIDHRGSDRLQFDR